MEAEVISSVPKEQLKPAGISFESTEKTERSSIELLRSYLEQERFDPTQNYPGLLSYAESRGNLLNINKPINLFLRHEYLEEIPNGSRLKKIRYNPISQEIYVGDWSWTTRAFHCPERGTFFDFPAQPRGQHEKNVLEGYQATESIIDFAYTLEHELKHDIQQQRLDAKEISYDVLRITKDYIMVGLLRNFDGGEYFYNNAHDDLFIEIDANDHASDFMDKVIPTGSSLARRIANPNDPPEHQHTVESVLLRRIDEGVASHHDNYLLSLVKNKIGIPSQEYNGSAEQIVSDFCDSVLKVYPEYIKKYPVLALEYNEDGSRRSLSDIENILKKTKHSENVLIGGQRIDSKRLGIIYHRLCKYSRKLQEEISGSTSSK